MRAVTRSRLLAAAEEMFLSRGFGGASVDAVAQAAGFTTGAVYSNFGGKADLFLAVLERSTERDLDTVRAAMAAAATDEQRLAVFTSSVSADPVRWKARVAATIEFVSHATTRPELQARLLAAQAAADEATRTILAALCDALGVDIGPELDALTRDLHALLNGYAIRALYDDSLDLPDVIAAGVNALLSSRVPMGDVWRSRVG